MSKRTYVALVGVAVAFILATGGLIASNMGFKLNHPLDAAGVGSNSGLNTISLPYNQQSGLNNWGDVRNDIGATNVQEVKTFVEATDTFNTYTGGKGQTADPVVPGEGAILKMGTTVNYIIAGSHDPALGVSLDAAGAGSNSGLNFFSVPYHTTAANVGDLRNDIGAASVQEVKTFVKATDTFNTYTGGKGQTADPIVPGEGVFLKMGTTVTYVPSHY